MPILDNAARNDLLQPGLGGAFVREGFGTAPPFTPTGNALAGMRMGVKDIFLVQGQRMGGGTPAWGAQQPIAQESAPAVQLCLEAGAHCRTQVRRSTLSLVTSRRRHRRVASANHP